MYLVLSLIVYLAMVLLLAIGCPDYLHKVEALSLFVPTSIFVSEYLGTPGGALELVSRWFTQLFYYPWLGAIAYSAMLGGCQFALCRAFGVKGRWRWASLALPLLLLWSFLGTGYVAFSIKSPAFAFQLPLGILCSLGIAWGYKQIKSLWLQCITLVLIAFVGYWAIGAFALVAVALCVGISIFSYTKQHAPLWTMAIVVTFGIGAIAIAPPVWMSVMPGQLMQKYMYMAGLPRYNANEWLRPTPVALTDDNFRRTLAMDRAIDDCRWQDASSIASNQQSMPTRLNVLLGDIALMRMGVAPDYMFAYPIGDAEYNSPRPESALHDAGAMAVSYNLGRVNYAYRWAMEYAVERGFSVEYLKYLAKCAMLNGELRLADKYLDVLSLTMFHKKWAKKYRRYLHHPEEMSKDPEFAQIFPIKTADNYIAGDGGKLEGYLWPIIKQARPTTPQMLQLSMIASLIYRDLDSFMMYLPAYWQQNKKLPRHFQEAVMFWSAINDNEEYQKYDIDDNMQRSFAEFVEASQRIEHLSLADRANLMKASYGKTFWYYMLYQTDLKVL